MSSKMVLVEGYILVDWLKIGLLVRDYKARRISSHGRQSFDFRRSRTSRSAMAADRAAVLLFQLHQSQQNVLSTMLI